MGLIFLILFMLLSIISVFVLSHAEKSVSSEMRSLMFEPEEGYSPRVKIFLSCEVGALLFMYALGLFDNFCVKIAIYPLLSKIIMILVCGSLCVYFAVSMFKRIIDYNEIGLPKTYIITFSILETMRTGSLCGFFFFLISYM
jgi:hypothetical protein